jgi:hypothetical protein
MQSLSQTPRTDIETLRNDIGRRLEGRRVWFYGVRRSADRSPPRGGQRVVWQHNDILRAAGVDSYIVRGQGRLARQNPFSRPHADDGGAPESWFLRTVRPDRDVVVVPGFRFRQLQSIPGRHKVVFSQNVFVTARAMGFTDTAWSAEGLRAIMCVSEGNAEVVRLSRPECPVLTVTNSVDASRFGPVEKERLVLSNGLSIGCEKNPVDTAIAAQLLFARADRVDGFQYWPLQDMPHEQVAHLLSRARALIFLSAHEGLGLLAIEAMLSDTLVFAFRRPPMSEYLPDRCLFEFGDLEGIADAVQDALDHPESWRPEVEAARETALGFNEAAQERSVLEAWLEIERELP